MGNGVKDNRSLLPDIIKIVCTCGIIFHHYQQLTGTYFYRGLNFWGGKFYFGYLVEVFFLLSGWVMVPYVQRIREQMSFRTFITGRLIRLLPSMIMATILYDVMLYVYVNFFDGTIRFPTEINIFGSIVTALGIGAWGITKDYEINNVSWYVSVLILCYIIMFILVYLSKKTRISLYYLLLIPIIVGIVRFYGVEYSYLPFFTTHIGRGYIHFFGGLLLGLASKRILKTDKERAGGQRKALWLRKAIGNVASATLDIYLFQLSTLMMFFIASNYLPIRLVSGKTMLIYLLFTFAFGYVYYILIGKRIFAALKKATGNW